jgi:hypothetical protein
VGEGAAGHTLANGFGQEQAIVARCNDAVEMRILRRLLTTIVLLYSDINVRS